MTEPTDWFLRMGKNVLLSRCSVGLEALKSKRPEMPWAWFMPFILYSSPWYIVMYRIHTNWHHKQPLSPIAFAILPTLIHFHLAVYRARYNFPLRSQQTSGKRKLAQNGGQMKNRPQWTMVMIMVWCENETLCACAFAFAFASNYLNVALNRLRSRSFSLSLLK